LLKSWGWVKHSQGNDLYDSDISDRKSVAYSNPPLNLYDIFSIFTL
jgi:hypothetical protein